MRPFDHLRTLLMRSSRTFVWSATAFGLIALLSFFAAIGYDFYRATLEGSQRSAANIAGLVESDIARNLGLFDLSLQAVIDGVNDPTVMGLEPRLRQKALFDTSVTARGLGALVVLDRNGSIVLDSLSAQPRTGNFADREYFVIHRDSPRDIGLYLSRPFQARLQGGIWSISVSRRISGPDGSFQGIASGTMRLDYFETLFGNVVLGKSGSIVLLRDDGVVIVPPGLDEADAGNNARAAAVVSQQPDQSRGSFNLGPSIYAFQRVAGLPLVVLVEQSRAQVLAAWWWRSIVLSAIFATMAGSVLVLVWLLDGELRRRAAAERAAAGLARIDGLTALANRRAFEEALAREWARADRAHQPISLVMLDVDHFKLFNDNYGHQEGDRVLRAIAAVIARGARRPADLAARYGGEEFAMLLPGTDTGGAMRVAAAVRDEVAALGIGHRGSPHGTVTVSAGVASFVPRVGLAAATMVADADAALYRAKNEGRNAVCLGNVVSGAFQRPVNRAS